MNVGITVHNLVVIGILATLFKLLARLAAGTALVQLPIIGPGLQLLAA